MSYFLHFMQHCTLNIALFFSSNYSEKNNIYIHLYKWVCFKFRAQGYISPQVLVLRKSNPVQKKCRLSWTAMRLQETFSKMARKLKIPSIFCALLRIILDSSLSMMKMRETVNKTWIVCSYMLRVVPYALCIYSYKLENHHIQMVWMTARIYSSLIRSANYSFV